jgi:hypothetical protein
LASRAGETNESVDVAFRDINVPENWRDTLVGGAVHAVGISGRIADG